MTFNPNDIVITPNEWFWPNVVYEGRGRAEFEDPTGTIEGPVVVKFNEYGESSAQMVVETLTSDRQLQFGSTEFLSGEKPVPEDGVVSLPLTFNSNPCKKLTVETAEGEFSSTQGIHYGRSITVVGNEPEKIDFHLLRSEFQSNNTEAAHYWVFPLANFISNFRQRHLELDQHPLRIYPTPLVPHGLPEKETVRAVYKANSKNHLIIFQFNNGLGFIEPVVNYETRKENLLNGRERYAITSIMVGEVSGKSIEFSELDSWLPSEFIRLLSLASGSVVSAPWIEFRDARGMLVKRIHVSWEGSSFSKGRRAIREEIHTGVGYMLTRYASSADRGKGYLRVALKHLIQAGLDGESIEDSFVYLCRALEGLCEHYGTRKQYLLRELTAPNELTVKQALRTAANQIKSEAAAAAAAGDDEQSRILNRIADRTLSNPANVDSDFGLAVCALLKRFNLPDADIIDAHYLVNPRADGRPTLAAVLSHYRGAPTHTGYFNFSGKEHDASDILTVMDHLRDVVLRIIFQIVGYVGTYQPPVIRWTIDAKYDWVRADTPATELGYS
jgi:hypothetical protein